MQAAFPLRPEIVLQPSETLKGLLTENGDETYGRFVCLESPTPTLSVV